MLPFCPHAFQTALLVRHSTKTSFYLLEFPSTSLTLSFRGQLCLVEVLLTPHIERLCLHPFQSKSSSKCYWFFDPYLLEHLYFCACHCEWLLLHAICCSWWITDFFFFFFFDELVLEFWYKSFAFLGHWSPELFCHCLGFVGANVSAEVWWSYSLEDQCFEVGALLTQYSIPKTFQI